MTARNDNDRRDDGYDGGEYGRGKYDGTEYGGMDALMAALVGEPLPEAARRDTAFMTAHRAAAADVALLREQLGLIGETLAHGAGAEAGTEAGPRGEAGAVGGASSEVAEVEAEAGPEAGPPVGRTLAAGPAGGPGPAHEAGPGAAADPSVRPLSGGQGSGSGAGAGPLVRPLSGGQGSGSGAGAGPLVRPLSGGQGSGSGAGAGPLVTSLSGGQGSRSGAGAEPLVTSLSGRRSRSRPLAVALRGLAAAVAATAVVGMGWLVVQSGSGRGDGSAGSSAADTAAGPAHGGGHGKISHAGYLACARLVVEGTVAEVEPVPGTGQDRVTLDVDRYYKPGKGQDRIVFPMDTDVAPRPHPGDHVLVGITRGQAEPDVWTTGEKEIARDRAWITAALPDSRTLPCE